MKTIYSGTINLFIIAFLLVINDEISCKLACSGGGRRYSIPGCKHDIVKEDLSALVKRSHKNGPGRGEEVFVKKRDNGQGHFVGP